MSDPYTLLITRLKRLRPTFTGRLTGELSIMGNLETQTPARPYHWDGLRRGGDPESPDVYFQYTLAGRGAYQDRAGRTRLLAGMAFLAVVPSEHCYYLPEDSRQWTFLWLRIQHPYIVGRLVELVRRQGAVLHAPPHSRLITQVVELLEQAAEPGGEDRYERERALFDLLIEIERACHTRATGPHDPSQVLPHARKLVLDHLHSPMLVEELARPWGMSRSRFSHFFRATTGLPPGRFIAQVRLEEAQRRLAYTSQTLKQIAAACGLADANHLCKVFRRHHHMSPGNFRRQMRQVTPTTVR